MLIAGIDIGTTSLCGILYDSDGPKILTTENTPNRACLTASTVGEMLQDPLSIVRQVTGLLDKLTAVGRPEAIGITGQMHGILCLNREGMPVSPLITWQDGRGDSPAPDGSTWAEQLTAITGLPFHTGYGLTTWYWMWKHHAIPPGTTAICTIADYAAMVLAGRKTPVTDATMAASLGGFIPEKAIFHPALRDKAGIDTTVLPTLVPSGTAIGFHPEGAAVYCACGDNQAGFLATVTHPATQIGINMGTGSQVAVWSDKPLSAPRTELRPYFNHGYLSVTASLNGGAALAALADFMENCCREMGAQPAGSVFQRLAAIAEQPGPALPVVPNLCGIRNLKKAGGAITGITPDTFTPAALIRGFYDGIAAELAEMLTALPAEARCGKKELRCAGNGLRKNPALVKRIATLTGLPAYICPEPEEAALGAALCALYGKTGAGEFI